MDPDLKGLDLYEILGIQQSASEDEIKSSYEKKAQQLSKIVSLLTNPAARSAYDESLNSKVALRLSDAELEDKLFLESLELKIAELKKKTPPESYMQNYVDSLNKKCFELLEKTRAFLISKENKDMHKK